MLRRVRFSLILLFVSFVAAPAIAGEFSPGFEVYLDDVSDAEIVGAILYLEDQVDLVSLQAQLDAQRVSPKERHETVIEALQAMAVTTQPRVIAQLDDLKSRGLIEGYTPYWITNMIVVGGRKAAFYELSERVDIERIEVNFQVELIEPIHDYSGGRNVEVNQVTPGVRACWADSVWYQYGITGAGRIIAGMDTGVDGTHPALSSRWAGTRPGYQWNWAWKDPVYGTTFPTDSDGHGTHTMGTMTGLGAPTADTIGIAWGAWWIADRSIMSNLLTLTNNVTEGYEWMADPDGDPGTTWDVPDVCQNSWGVHEGFTGFVDCDTRWQAVINALEAAGCAVVYSAGNEGPGAGTHRSPADWCTSENTNFSVGAVDATSYSWPYPIASFSSRGPSTCSGFTPPLNIKPEVVGPGVNVFSSVPGGGYNGTYSGTSMAGPHVAGVFALMREAYPAITVTQMKDLVRTTARDLGAAGNENTYGYGMVNALACVEGALALAAGTYGWVEGVVDDGTDAPIVGATVTIVGYNSGITNASGYYITSGEQGNRQVICQATGFIPDTQYVNIIAADTVTLNFTLVALPPPDVAIWEPDPTPITGPMLETAYNNAGYSTVRSSDFSSVQPWLTPDGTQVLYVCLGIYSNNYIVPNGSAEAVAIESYITSGGHVYIEGGDMWFWDPQYQGGHDFGPAFHVTTSSDGSAISAVTGVGGTFTGGLSYSYPSASGESNYHDVLGITGGSFIAFNMTGANPGPGTIAYDGGPGGKTIGCSFELGSLDATGAEFAELVDSLNSFYFGGVESIGVTSPAGGAVWYVDSTRTITWTSMNTSGTVDIHYSTDNGGSWNQIVLGTPDDGSHPWTVPNAPSTICLVRVRDGDGSPEDISDLFEIRTTPVVTVVYPNGSETLDIGTQYNLSYNIGPSVSVDSVVLDYSTDSGGSWTRIAADTDGSPHPWTVPNAPSTLCRLRATVYDDQGTHTDDVSDTDWTIADMTAPTNAVVYPNGGEDLAIGANVTLVWTSDDELVLDDDTYAGTIKPVVEAAGDAKGGCGGVIDIVAVDSLWYSTDNGGSWSFIAAVTSGDTSYAWTVPNEPSTQCLLRLVTVDGNGNTTTDQSDGVWAISDQTAPTVAVAYPNGGETLYVDSVATIMWSASDNIGLDSVLVEHSTDNGESWTTTASMAPNDTTFDWTVPGPETDSALVRVTACDAAGNCTSDESDAVFTIVDLTDVPEWARGTIPTQFDLLPVFPNPFNPTTTVVFALPEPTDVKLVVYDVLGREVAVPVDTRLDSGWYQIHWDGGELPSGVYFARIVAGQFTKTTKMMLLK